MSWLHRIPGFQRRAPLRAGVLNTGELVLIDDTGHAQIFTEATTDLIRDALDGSVSFLDIAPVTFPPVAVSGDHHDH